jgi:nucleoside-diphosphate-sugar epimerase
MDIKDGDLTLPLVEVGLTRFIEVHGVELVIHLAAVVGREFGEDDVANTIHSNALMTTRVARATAAGKARLMYVSTSEIYGDQGLRACRESDRKTVPHNLYGLSKRWGEEAATLYCPVGLQIIRLSMPYGPGLPAGRGRAAIINMIWQATHNKSIPVHKGAMRSWCWIGDTARGIALVAENGERAQSMHALENGIGAYNVGNDLDEHTMIEVADYACQLAGASRELIRLTDAPSNQTVIKRLSMAKLRALGWTPKVDLYGGMEATHEVIKQFYTKEGEVYASREELAECVRNATLRANPTGTAKRFDHAGGGFGEGRGWPAQRVGEDGS